MRSSQYAWPIGDDDDAGRRTQRRSDKATKESGHDWQLTLSYAPDISYEPTTPLVLFSSKIFDKMSTIAFSFIFDKYCLIMD